MLVFYNSSWRWYSRLSSDFGIVLDWQILQKRVQDDIPVEASISDRFKDRYFDGDVIWSEDRCRWKYL